MESTNIDHGWMEQPPTAPDRQALVDGKKGRYGNKAY
jgi:hypothetical protein